MGFMNFEFPNSDYYKHDLRELIALVKELAKEVETVGEGILEQANAYTDEQLAGYQEQIEQLKRDVDTEVAEVMTAFDDLKSSVNASLNIVNNRIDGLEDTLEADIQAVNARTDLAIEQNNEYILSEVSKFLAQIEVLNILTGDYVTIQNMFNYLATLHMTDAILYSVLATRLNTYTMLANYGMTYTQLAMNGDNIIVQQP